MKITSDVAEKDTVLSVAKAMCAAARTAPKARGWDLLHTCILTGDDLLPVADEMERLAGVNTGLDFFIRDAGNVRDSEAMVLIGTEYKQRGLGKGCSLCNFDGCADCAKKGGLCVNDPMDLGIALGSAVAIAADNRIDNRMMFSAGQAAVSLGIMDEKVRCVVAIPLAATGKSVFFDRKPKK